MRASRAPVQTPWSASPAGRADIRSVTSFEIHQMGLMYCGHDARRCKPTRLCAAGRPPAAVAVAELSWPQATAGSVNWLTLAGQPQNLISYHLRLLRARQDWLPPIEAASTPATAITTWTWRAARRRWPPSVSLCTRRSASLPPHLLLRVPNGPCGHACSSPVPVTAPAHRSPRPCCATGLAAMSR